MTSTGAPSLSWKVSRRSTPLLRGSDRLARTMLSVAAAITPLIFVPWSDETFALPKLLTLVVLMCGASLAAAFQADRWRFLPAVDLLLAAFAVAILAATAFSYDPATSILGEFPEYQGVIALGAAVAGFAVARLVFDLRTLRAWMAVVASVGALVAGYALVQATNLDPIWGDTAGERTFSTLGQPNTLAAFLVVVLPLTAVTALTSRRRGRWILAALLQMLGLMTTMSRGGLLGCAVAAVVLVVALGPPRHVQRRRLLAGSALVFLVIVSVPGLRTTFGHALDRAETAVDASNESIRQHLALWEVAADITRAHPWFGTGPSTFPIAFADAAPDTLGPQQLELLAGYRPESPHNVPLTISAEAGVPALAAYLGLVGSVVALGMATLRSASTARRLLLAGLLAAAAGHLTTDLFLTGEVTTTWLYWVVLGGIVALGRNRRSVIAS